VDRRRAGEQVVAEQRQALAGRLGDGFLEIVAVERVVGRLRLRDRDPLDLGR
jgi:hypothetical protein